jgi:hypothetical protein
MKILAIPCKARDLEPGDLFSAAGPEYWDHLDPKYIGERVYIRTETDASEGANPDAMVYRIVIDEDRRAELMEALRESVKLQSHYARLLNEWDGGRRMLFATAEAWLERLRRQHKRRNAQLN